jgi:hypothetical protein
LLGSVWPIRTESGSIAAKGNTNVSRTTHRALIIRYLEVFLN